MKMIKLSERHYVIVSNSKVRQGDWVLFNNEALQTDYFDSHFGKWEFKNKSVSPVEYQMYDKPKKITHSTQRLYANDFWTIRELKLSEVKELFSEDTDVWSRKLEYLKKVNEDIKHKSQDERIWIFGASDLGFTAGYKQALEDNRGKKYTDADLFQILLDFIEFQHPHHEPRGSIIERFIKTRCQPKTEWNVEFFDGKLKLV